MRGQRDRPLSTLPGGYAGIFISVIGKRWFAAPMGELQVLLDFLACYKWCTGLLLVGGCRSNAQRFDAFISKGPRVPVRIYRFTGPTVYRVRSPFAP